MTVLLIGNNHTHSIKYLINRHGDNVKAFSGAGHTLGGATSTSGNLDNIASDRGSAMAIDEVGVVYRLGVPYSNVDRASVQYWMQPGR